MTAHRSCPTWTLPIQATAMALCILTGICPVSVGIGAEYLLVGAGVGVGSFATTVDFLATLHCLGQ